MRTWLSLSLISSWLLVLACAVSPQDVESFLFASSAGLSAALSTRSGASALPRFASRVGSTASSSTVAAAATQGTVFDQSSTSPLIKAPPALYQGAADAGAKKAALSFMKTFHLAIAAGAHIGFGAYLALTVGGACFQIATDNPGLQKIILGAFGLPLGLMMSVVSGAEVFTGNTALVTTAVMEGKASWLDLIKNWTASYLGNFLGSLFLAYLAFHSGTLGTGPAAAAIATAKCSLSWPMAFIRGLLCNWLIAMAVYIASGCSSMSGKMIAIWFPVSAFVAMGLDNSVANMFLIPLGILRGAPITISQMFLKNLIPVTLGNIVGGAICAMAPFGLTHGS